MAGESGGRPLRAARRAWRQRQQQRRRRRQQRPGGQKKKTLQTLEPAGVLCALDCVRRVDYARQRTNDLCCDPPVVTFCGLASTIAASTPIR